MTDTPILFDKTSNAKPADRTNLLPGRSPSPAFMAALDAVEKLVHWPKK